MLRITIIEILLVSLPFVFFGLYRWVVSAKRRAAGAAFDETPYQILLFAGAALSLGGLIVMVLTRGDHNERGRVYIPAHAEDGRIVPGRFVDRDEVDPALLSGPPQDRETREETGDRGGGEGGGDGDGAEGTDPAAEPDAP